MRDRLLNIFNYLDKNSVKYFLLRPIDFTKNVEDIDLVISRTDFTLLLNVLIKDSKKTHLKYTNARESIQLFIDDILLDIKFNICFLPRKSLFFNKNIPTCTTIIKEDRYFFPDVNDEVLFTFWTYHLLLDKVNSSLSSTYVIYLDNYSKRWEKFIESKYFITWTQLIFYTNSNKALELIRSFFTNNMAGLNYFDNKKIQNLAIISNKLILNFYFDKYYFKLLRLSGVIKKKRTIKEIQAKINYEV
jgi:hypothetical protein